MSQITFYIWKPYQNDENCFLFYVIRCFRLWDNYIFCIGVLVMQKNDSKRKLSLILQFKTLQTRQQIVTIHILSNTFRSIGNKAMKKRKTKNAVYYVIDSLKNRSIDRFLDDKNIGVKWTLKCYPNISEVTSSGTFKKAKGN